MTERLWSSWFVGTGAKTGATSKEERAAITQKRHQVKFAYGGEGLFG